jgi:penicillin-binding protein A
VTLNRELRILTRALLAAFAIIVLAAAYWAAVERDRLLARQDNPRLLEARASAQRGAIYESGGELLASSVPTDNAQGSRVRQYRLPAFYGALGYFSLTYGTGGIETDYDRLLSGADLPRTIEQLLFRAPLAGSDIQLTLDANVQNEVFSAFGDHRGAVVVMNATQGHILAILSQPAYDPNTLDNQWATLLEDPGNPFFNRATQGRYQPGGMVQTPLLALFALGNIPLDEPRAGASAPINLDSTLLTCAIQPPRSSLSLTEAYRYGCPAPFLQAAQNIQSTQVVRALQQLNPLPSEDAQSIDLSSSEALREHMLGQGTQLVSPIDMVLLTSAIINEGNAPQPRTLLATRAPANIGTPWTTVIGESPTLPIMTAEAAQQLQSIMTLAASEQVTSASDVTLGMHVARAYTGTGSHVWFIGFATRGTGESVAVAVVIEDTRDTNIASEIGLRALNAAIEAIQTSSILP